MRELVDQCPEKRDLISPPLEFGGELPRAVTKERTGHDLGEERRGST
jgi:hypothetical protein